MSNNDFPSHSAILNFFAKPKNSFNQVIAEARLWFTQILRQAAPDNLISHFIISYSPFYYNCFAAVDRISERTLFQQIIDDADVERISKLVAIKIVEKKLLVLGIR